MICGAYNKSTKSPCTCKGKGKYDGKCGNHRDRSNDKKVESFDCCVCMEHTTGKVTFLCGHYVCTDCWVDMKVIAIGDIKCPLCRGCGSGISVDGKNMRSFNVKLLSALKELNRNLTENITDYNQRLREIQHIAQQLYGDVPEQIQFELTELGIEREQLERHVTDYYIKRDSIKKEYRKAK